MYLAFLISILLGEIPNKTAPIIIANEGLEGRKIVFILLSPVSIKFVIISLEL